MDLYADVTDLSSKSYRTVSNKPFCIDKEANPKEGQRVRLAWITTIPVYNSVTAKEYFHLVSRKIGDLRETSPLSIDIGYWSHQSNIFTYRSQQLKH